MDGGRPAYKLPKAVALRKDGPMFSRGFIRFSTGLDIGSTSDFAQSREIIDSKNDTASPIKRLRQQAPRLKVEACRSNLR
jgi:hypothetical protein